MQPAPVPSAVLKVAGASERGDIYWRENIGKFEGKRKGKRLSPKAIYDEGMRGWKERKRAFKAANEKVAKQGVVNGFKVGR